MHASCAGPHSAFTCQRWKQALFSSPCTTYKKYSSMLSRSSGCLFLLLEVITKSWPCCLITGHYCLCHLMKPEVYQRLSSQILKSGFLKYPEDWHHHKASQVRAAPEMAIVCVQSTFITSVEAAGSLLFMQVLWDRYVIREYNLTSCGLFCFDEGMAQDFSNQEINFRLNTYASLVGGGGGVGWLAFSFLLFDRLFEYFQPNKSPVTFMQSCASFLTVQ